MQLKSVITIATLSALTAHGALAQTLRGSKESVDLMYTRAQQNDLIFTRTTEDVYNAVRAGAFDLITENEDLELDRATFPFVLPNTHRFADSLAKEYHAGCGERIGVTSGARPIDKQPHNASPKSVHPTGMAVDFRKPRNPVCLKWMRDNLLALENKGIIEATEEKHPAHFHVAVLRQQPEKRFALAPIPESAVKTRTAAGDVSPKLTHRASSKSRRRAKVHKASADSTAAK